VRKLNWLLVAAAIVAVPQFASVSAQPAPAATANSEDARLTAFLDKEFATSLQTRPQLATRLGMKEGEDRLDDISDAAELQFPAKDPSTGQLAESIGRALPRAERALETAAVARRVALVAVAVAGLALVVAVVLGARKGRQGA